MGHPPGPGISEPDTIMSIKEAKTHDSEFPHFPRMGPNPQRNPNSSSGNGLFTGGFTLVVEELRPALQALEIPAPTPFLPGKS